MVSLMLGYVYEETLALKTFHSKLDEEGLVYDVKLLELLAVTTKADRILWHLCEMIQGQTWA